MRRKPVKAVDFRLRPATRADYDFLYILSRLCSQPYVEAIWGWDEADQQARYRATFTLDENQMIEVNDAPVGQLLTQTTEHTLIIDRFYLLPELRGKRIGSAILSIVTTVAEAQRLTMTLRVFKANRGARRLYERFGFSVIEETPTHFQMRRRYSTSVKFRQPAIRV